MTGTAPDPSLHNTSITPRSSQEAYIKFYLASQELAHASRSEEIWAAVSRTLAGGRFPALLLVVQQDPVSDEEVLVPFQSTDVSTIHPYFVGKLPPDMPVFTVAGIEPGLRTQEEGTDATDSGKHFTDCLILDPESIDQNSSVATFSRRMGFVSSAFIPVIHIKHLDLLLVLGSRQVKLTRDLLQGYIGLADLARGAYERLYTMQVLEKRLSTLQSLNVISQVVALQGDLDELFKVIHKEIRQLFGDLTFFIAIYDKTSNMVAIPYLFEMGSDEMIAPPPFVLGVGLTSLVITNRQPLLFVEDTARRIQELGAQQTGLPAKSWLGVPLLVAGEATGAIVLQDLFHEHRFDEDDLQLMTTIASQVAVAIRYVNLLTNAQLQAERERALNEITAQIRASTDAQKILQITAREVARIVGARRTRVILSPHVEEPVTKNL